MNGLLVPKYGLGRLPRYCLIPGTLVRLADTCKYQNVPTCQELQTSTHLSSDKNKFENLQLTAMQLWFIQKYSILNSLNFHKLYVSKTFGLTILICQNSYPVYRSTGLKMLLHLLRCACIVHLNLEENITGQPNQQEHVCKTTHTKGGGREGERERA